VADEVEFLNRVYHWFNAREMDKVLGSLQEHVIWANGLEGGHLHGRDEVRSYWTRQWATMDPHVQPTNFTHTPEGEITVNVHQTVYDRDGNLLADRTVTHVFRIANNLIERFDIREA
jgi:hypothetical protein